MPDQRRPRRTLVLAALLAACGRPPAVTTPPPLDVDWAAVIADAWNPEPAEVVHDLIAIVPGDSALRWTEVDGVPHVRMVTVVADSLPYAGQRGRRHDTGGEDVWVTAVPELRSACRAPGLAGEPLRRRVRQLLGLVPDDGVQAAVELWVRPEDLFRPAPDPEITDSTAGLVMPADVPPWYRAWFNRLRATQYVQSVSPPSRAYPWTQLGYTYDWGRSEKPHRGLSEFVVRAGAVVRLAEIEPLERYCRDSGTTNSERDRP